MSAYKCVMSFQFYFLSPLANFSLVYRKKIYTTKEFIRKINQNKHFTMFYVFEYFYNYYLYFDDLTFDDFYETLCFHR